MTSYIFGIIIGFVLGMSATVMVTLATIDKLKAEKEPIIEFDSESGACGPVASLRGPVFETFVDVIENGKKQAVD